MAVKIEKWVVAQKKHKLSDKHVQMARELGLNPDKLGKIDNRYNHSSGKGLYYFKPSELQLFKEYEQNNIYNKGEENFIANYFINFFNSLLNFFL